MSKWNEEIFSKVEEMIGTGRPVSSDTVQRVAEELGDDFSTRSVAAKLRKSGIEVAKATERKRSWNEDEEAQLSKFVQSNKGSFTYAEIAEQVCGGKFNTRQVQGKILSMEMTDWVKAAEAPAVIRKYSAEEESTIVSMANSGKFLEQIAEVINREVDSVRGKCLSLLRQGVLEAIPKLQSPKATTQADVFDGIDIEGLTVAELAEKTGKTERGIKTILTRRELTAKDYDGQKRAAKRKKAV